MALKSGLATNNHIRLLIVCPIINIFPFYFQTRICYVFYALDRHHNLLVLTHCKLMTIKPQFFTNFDWNWSNLEYRGLVEMQKANSAVNFDMYTSVNILAKNAPPHWVGGRNKLPVFSKTEEISFDPPKNLQDKSQRVSLKNFSPYSTSRMFHV